MSSRLIRLSSRAVGRKRHVKVHIYPTLDQMRTAAVRFNGHNTPDAAGITQTYCDHHGTPTTPVIRLAATHLGTRIISHEIHHAATAIYGSTIPDTTPAADELTHFNEPFAYLYSDLFTSLVKALYRHGYYDTPTEDA